MTLEEVGAHAKLMAWSWEHGPVPNDMKRIATILSVHMGQARRVFAVVSERWRLNEQGQWYNRRLEKTRADQAAYVERQRSNGLKGGRPKKPTENPRVIFGLSETVVSGNPKETSPSPVSNLQDPPRKEHSEEERTAHASAAVWRRRETSPYGQPLSSGDEYHKRHCPSWGFLACARGFCIPKYLWPKWEKRQSIEALRAFVERVMRRTPEGAGDREEEFWPRQFAAEFGTTAPAGAPTDRAGKALTAAERVISRQLDQRKALTP